MFESDIPLDRCGNIKLVDLCQFDFIGGLLSVAELGSLTSGPGKSIGVVIFAVKLDNDGIFITEVPDAT